MRVGIADRLGWAVAVTASPRFAVVDRRRIELVEPGVTRAPIHYVSRRLDRRGHGGARLAAGMLGARAGDVLDGPRAALGPPWTKDHRQALAAAIMAAR
jgi:hypothetical protein